jgi:hypothetical protein
MLSVYPAERTAIITFLKFPFEFPTSEIDDTLASGGFCRWRALRPARRCFKPLQLPRYLLKLIDWSKIQDRSKRAYVVSFRRLAIPLPLA